MDPIEKFLDEENWAAARRLILKELKNTPDHHWLLVMLSNTYYEEHNYEKALEIVSHAKELMPRCPIVLWHYAGTMDMLGQEREAIAVWKRLLRRGAQGIAFGECGEGIRHTESLLNDARYRIGSSYWHLRNRRMAKRYFEDHLKHRKPGLPSIYSRQEVLKRLRDVDLV